MSSSYPENDPGAKKEPIPHVSALLCQPCLQWLPPHMALTGSILQLVSCAIVNSMNSGASLPDSKLGSVSFELCELEQVT